MRRIAAYIVSLAAGAVVLCSSGDARAYELGDDLSIGGRIFADAAWLSPGERTAGPTARWETNRGEFRRLRLFAAGTFQDRLSFKLQFDFAGGDAALKDAYIGGKDVPVVGSVKIGHFKEPFSLESLTSNKYLLTMERAMAVDALAPGRNTGIAVGTSALDERMTWRLGAFREADDFGRFVTGGGGGATGRLTGLPWRNDDELVHLGLAYSLRVPSRSTDETDSRRRMFDPEARPESHLAPVGIEIPGDGVSTTDVQLIGLEALSMTGPWTLSAEFIGARLQTANGTSHDDPFLRGWNTALSLFATGESRPYDAADGTLSRPHPRRPFLSGGPGAWELVARFSHLDFWQAGGNTTWNTTAGFNWYWSSRARIMLNYGVGTPNFSDTPKHFLQTRAQIDF